MHKLCLFIIILFFVIESRYIALDDQKLEAILLPLPRECSPE